MCHHCRYTEPTERPPCMTHLAPLAYVHVLEDLGVDRGRALLMTPHEALAALAVVTRDRYVIELLADEGQRARAA